MPREFIRKITLLLVAVICLTMLNNHISHSSLSRTAIVVCLAIDYDRGYVVTAQTVLSGGQSDSTGGGNKYVGIVGKGVSMTDCIASIRSQCGVDPGFRHTSLVLFGMSLIQTGTQDYCAEFLFQNDLIPDDVSIAVTRSDMAAEVLGGETPLTDISGFHISRSQNGFAPALGITNTDLRRYVANVFSYNTANVLPIVDVSEPTSVIGDKGGDRSHLYSISTALVCRDRLAVALDRSQTDAVVLATSRLNEGWYETVTADRIIDYRIDYSRGELSVEDVALAVVEIDLQVVLMDICEGNSSTTDLAAYTDADRRALADSVTNAVRDAYRTCADLGLDVFGLHSRFLASCGADWSLAQDPDYLHGIRLEVKVKSKVK